MSMMQNGRRMTGQEIWRKHGLERRALLCRNPRSSVERLELEGTASTTRLFHRPGGRWDWDQPLVRDEGLLKPEAYQGQVEGRVTTKFVRDWRETICVWRLIQWKMDAEKPFGGQRICYSEERDDTFPPATGAHSSNLLPLLHLQRQAEGQGSSDHYKALACGPWHQGRPLQVPPTDPIQVYLNNSPFIISRTCQGRDRDPKYGIGTCVRFRRKIYSFTFCAEQPCLAKCDEATILMPFWLKWRLAQDCTQSINQSQQWREWLQRGQCRREGWYLLYMKWMEMTHMMMNWLELQNQIQILIAVDLLWMQSRLLYGKKYKLQLSHWKASWQLWVQHLMIV